MKCLSPYHLGNQDGTAIFLRDACKNAVNTTGLEVLDFGAEDFAEQQVGEA